MQKFSSSIINIEWERIYLDADFLIETDGLNTEERNWGVFLLNDEKMVEAEFVITSKEEKVLHTRLNVTNNGTNRCVQNGNYTVIITDDEDYISEVGFSGTDKQLLDWGRCFRYNGTSGAYTITCMLDEYSEESRFLLLVYNENRRAMANRVGYDLEQHPELAPLLQEKHFFLIRFLLRIKSKIVSRFMSRKKKFRDRLERRVRRTIYNYTYKFYGEKRKKNIVFISEQTTELPLNMKALYERMLERGMDKEYDIHFSLRNATSAPQTAWSAIKYIYKLARSYTVIVDDHVPLFNHFVLKPDTKVIQIWHAGAGFKGVGYSRWGHLGCPGPYSAHRQYTYSISGSASISHFFSEQFGILDEQVIPTGMPRMDKYVNEENRKQVTARLYEEFPQFKGKKIILFAPTYRGQNKLNAYYPYDRIDFQQLYEYCCKTDSVVIFKMHPWVNEDVPIEGLYADRFYDFTRYGDINEIFYITDLLITDYSSSMYEFILMDKPMLLYPYDKVQYATSRGFHRDYDSNVPGKICYTFDEIMHALEHEDFEYEKVKDFKSHYFDFVDDKSCDRIIDWLILDQMPEQYSKALEDKRAHIGKVRGTIYDIDGSSI